MERDQKLMQIEEYYAEKGLNVEVFAKLAPGFLWTLGYGAELVQGGGE